MRKDRLSIYVIWIALAEAVGLLAGILSRNGIELYSDTVIKPLLAPPPILFPIVWTVLYALMAVGAARIYMSKDNIARKKGMNLFIAQLIINFFWPLIFFNTQAFGFAFSWLMLLWTLVLWMTLVFRKVDCVSALLQIPYLIWLSFAAYLNLSIWLINR